MRSGSNILIFLIFWGIVLAFDSSAAPALNEKGTPGLGEVQAQKEKPDGPPQVKSRKLFWTHFFISGKTVPGSGWSGLSSPW
jgi:hypothetical protein